MKPYQKEKKIYNYRWKSKKTTFQMPNIIKSQSMFLFHRVSWDGSIIFQLKFTGIRYSSFLPRNVLKLEIFLTVSIVELCFWLKSKLKTWGILKSLRRLATCMEVTLEAAPTTPEMTLFRTSGEDPSLHLYSVSSPMLLIEPENKNEIWFIFLFQQGFLSSHLNLKIQFEVLTLNVTIFFQRINYI